MQAFYLLLGFAENQGVFWDFKIQNSVQQPRVQIMEVRIIKVLLYFKLYDTSITLLLS